MKSNSPASTTTTTTTTTTAATVKLEEALGYRQADEQSATTLAPPQQQPPPRFEAGELRTISQKYEISKLISRGRSGELFAGRHLATSRPVAIRVLLPPVGADDFTLKAFRREANAIAHRNTRIDYQHVIQTFDYGLLPEDKTPYVVTEILPAQNLEAFLKVINLHEPLSISSAVRIARQIAEGLWAAHRCGVVHQDLRPSHIFLDEDYDGQLVAKVADFGFSKLRERRESGSDDGAESTPDSPDNPEDYLSPEQLVGSDADERSDLYGLGVILRRMLCHCVASEGMPAAPEDHESGRAPEPSQRVSNHALREVDHLIRQLLDDKPSHRPGTAAEVAHRLLAIENILSGAECLSPFTTHDLSSTDSPHTSAVPFLRPPSPGVHEDPQSGDGHAIRIKAERKKSAVDPGTEPNLMSPLAPAADKAGSELSSCDRPRHISSPESGETIACAESSGSELSAGNEARHLKDAREAPAAQVTENHPNFYSSEQEDEQQQEPSTVVRTLRPGHVVLAVTLLVVISVAGVALITKRKFPAATTTTPLPASSLPSFSSSVPIPPVVSSSQQSTVTGAKAAAPPPARDFPMERNSVSDAGDDLSEAEKEKITSPSAPGRSPGNQSTSAAEQQPAAAASSSAPVMASLKKPVTSVQANAELRGAIVDSRGPEPQQRLMSGPRPALTSSVGPMRARQQQQQPPARCEISLSQNSLILHSGGSALVQVRASDPTVKAGQIKGDTADWANVVFFPEGVADTSATFSVRTVGHQEGTYQIRFAAPCGSKNLVVKVLRP